MKVRVIVDLEIEYSATDIGSKEWYRGLELLRNAENSVVIDVKDGVKFIQRVDEIGALR
jgi:hypothetical protein